MYVGVGLGIGQLMGNDFMYVVTGLRIGHFILGVMRCMLGPGCPVKIHIVLHTNNVI